MCKTYFGVIILFASEVKVIRYTHTLTGTIEYVKEEGEEVSTLVAFIEPEHSENEIGTNPPVPVLFRVKKRHT